MAPAPQVPPPCIEGFSHLLVLAGCSSPTSLDCHLQDYIGEQLASCSPSTASPGPCLSPPCSAGGLCPSCPTIRANPSGAEPPNSSGGAHGGGSPLCCPGLRWGRCTPPPGLGRRRRVFHFQALLHISALLLGKQLALDADVMLESLFRGSQQAPGPVFISVVSPQAQAEANSGIKVLSSTKVTAKPNKIGGKQLPAACN